MEQELAFCEHAASARSRIFADWVCPAWVRRRPAPNGTAVRAARGTADHLPHQGFLLRTREPRAERRAREVRQADRSGNVSAEGRSLRSSPSAGKPRTWRREAVMGTASKPLGKAMYVAPKPEWDWLLNEQRKLYARSEETTGWPRPAGLSSRSIMESRVHNERCTPGSEGGARKPTGESRQGAGRPPYATSTSWPQASQWHRTKPRATSPHPT